MFTKEGDRVAINDNLGAATQAHGPSAEDSGAFDEEDDGDEPDSGGGFLEDSELENE